MGKKNEEWKKGLKEMGIGSLEDAYRRKTGNEVTYEIPDSYVVSKSGKKYTGPNKYTDATLDI